MPLYDYECQRCGREDERSFSMADMPQTVPCPCGHEAVRVIHSVPTSFVKDREYVFDKAKCVMSNGRRYGRTDQQQHEIYRSTFEKMKRNQKRLKGSKHKHDIEWVGGMPGEMADSICEHEGDKQAVYKDPVPFLKKTGLYAGDN